MAKTKFYEFTVIGKLAFPMDMLRYDSCWPVNGDSVANMSAESRGLKIVTLRSLHEPTDARWSSFLWTVQRDTLSSWVA